MSVEKFVALLVGIVTILAMLGAGLRILLRISWDTAKLVQQFNEHVRDDDKIHDDIEARMRILERRPARWR